MAKGKIVSVFLQAHLPITASKSTRMLMDRRIFLNKFEGFDDFIFRAEEVDPRQTRLLEYHFVVARAALARLLWKHEVFIGVDLIDRIFFDVIADPNVNDPLKEFLKRVVE
jgi:hypothetical protein